MREYQKRRVDFFEGRQESKGVFRVLKFLRKESIIFPFVSRGERGAEAKTGLAALCIYVYIYPSILYTRFR